MKRIVLDTNVVVSFLTDRNLQQQKIAERIFEQAAAGKVSLVLHQMVVTETVHVLRNLYRVSPQQTAASIRDLLGLPGVIAVDAMPWPRIFEIWPERIAGYADAALAAILRAGDYDSLATFDGDFRRRLRRLGLSSSLEI